MSPDVRIMRNAQATTAGSTGLRGTRNTDDIFCRVPSREGNGEADGLTGGGGGGCPPPPCPPARSSTPGHKRRDRERVTDRHASPYRAYRRPSTVYYIVREIIFTTTRRHGRSRGEDVTNTYWYSEFTEEAARPNGAVDRLFTECNKRRTVYKGPVDDRRIQPMNEAWIETVAVHFHAPDDIAAGPLSSRTRWQTPRRFVASHKMWVDAVARDNRHGKF